MKLDHLITQYLYQQKRISLPGIGTFTVEGGTVQFDKNYDAVISNELIEYVKSQTGKMHSLALSDIESFIMLNTQFLNIGKAMHLQGIGTLAKTKLGDLEFTAGEVVTERIEENPQEGRKPSVFGDDYSYVTQPNTKRNWILGLLGLLTLLIIILAGWGLFLNNTNSPAQNEVPAVHSDTTNSSLPVGSSVQTDTGTVRPSDSFAVSTPSNSQRRFIIEETTNKARATKRFNQLKELGKNILMDTKDSGVFKLYFVLPVNLADTGKIKDSLRRFYNSPVKIEQ